MPVFPTATPLTPSTVTGATVFPCSKGGSRNEVSLDDALAGMGVVTTAAAQTLSNKTLVTPALGTPSSGTLTNCTADGTTAVGFRGVPLNSQSADYTAVLADNGKCLYHPASDVSARTFTVPANASVAYPVGAVLAFANDSVGAVTVAIASDALVSVGTGATGSITLNQYEWATAVKVGATRWYISQYAAVDGGGGGVPTQITVADAGTDTTCYVGLFPDATGDLGPKTGDVRYNANTGVLAVDQPGGAPGTDTLEISHDGTNGKVESRSGVLRLIHATGSAVGVTRADASSLDVVYIHGTAGTQGVSVGYGGVLGVTGGGVGPSVTPTDHITCLNGSDLSLSSDGRIEWSNGVTISGVDTALSRVAPRVLSIENFAGTGGGTLRSVPLTPAQITSDQNDWAPPVAMFYAVSTDASRTLTGLSIGQVDGQIAEIWNVGTNPLVLADDSASSTAANRFLIPGGAALTLNARGKVLLRYRGAMSRWEVLPVGVAGGAGGQVQFNNSGAFGGAAALVYAGSGVHLTATAQASTDVPLELRAATGQTAPLLRAVANGVDKLEITGGDNPSLVLRPIGRSYAFTTDDGGGRFRISRSDSGNGLDVTPNSDETIIGAVTGHLVFYAGGGGQNIILTPNPGGGGDYRVQFGRRHSDSNVAVGTSVECWPANSQTFPAFSVMTPGGTGYRVSVPANSSTVGLWEDSSTTNRRQAAWRAEWAESTDATRKGRAVHEVNDTAAREYLRGVTDGSRGYPVFPAHAAAPDNALLPNGSVAFYTDGSGNLVIKLKDSGGTVRTGTVTLT
jgi:hypothetical protein